MALVQSGCSADVSETQSSSSEGEVVMYHADYPTYQTSSQLFDQATLVIEGKTMGDAKVESLNTQLSGDSDDPALNPDAGAPGAVESPAPVLPTDVVTIRQVRVTKVLKGDARVGDLIEVKQLGGLYEGAQYKEDSTVDLRPTKDYVLFLETYPGLPASLLNPVQGQYPVEASKISSLPGNSISISMRQLSSMVKPTP